MNFLLRSFANSNLFSRKFLLSFSDSFITTLPSKSQSSASYLQKDFSITISLILPFWKASRQKFQILKIVVIIFFDIQAHFPPKPPLTRVIFYLKIIFWKYHRFSSFGWNPGRQKNCIKKRFFSDMQAQVSPKPLTKISQPNFNRQLHSCKRLFDTLTFCSLKTEPWFVESAKKGKYWNSRYSRLFSPKLPAGFLPSMSPLTSLSVKNSQRNETPVL